MPFYVGKGHDKRAWIHLTPHEDDPNKHKTRKIKKALRQGKQILVEFIKTDLCEDDAFMWEVFWIAEYGRRDLGYGPLTNMTDGGEGRSGSKASIETRQKMSKSQSGINSSQYGIQRSEDVRKRMSEAQKGKKQSEETKAKRTQKLSKNWLIIHPDGEEEIINNLTQFCRDHNLNNGCMSLVANGHNKTHKGYRCQKI